MSIKDRVKSWLEDYKRRTNCTGVVLGISGGKDSTTVAMLAKTVWGDKAVGVLMPNGVQSDIDDSLEIVKTIGLEYRVVNISSMYDAFRALLPDTSEKALTNVAPRLRMITLYAIAQTLGYRVIGTGNASERFIGWFTKWGDGAFDFNPIAELTCSEVISLGKELCRDFGLDEKYIIKAPADGLTGKSDEANFGFSYESLDKVIANIRSGKEPDDDDVSKRIMELHRMTEHKRILPEVFSRKE